MRFVLTYVLTDAFEHLREPAVLKVAGEETVVVALEHLDEDPRDPSKSVVILTGTVELQAPPKAELALRQLAVGDLPDGTQTDEHRIRDWGDDPFPPTFDELPGSLRDFSRKVSRVLSSALVRTYELIRWRFDIHGQPRPYSSRGIQWSEDLGTRHDFPGEIKVHVGVHRGGTPLDVERGEKVDALLKAGAEEPLAHYMLREARVTFGNHNVSALALIVHESEVR